MKASCLWVCTSRLYKVWTNESLLSQQVPQILVPPCICDEAGSGQRIKRELLSLLTCFPFFPRWFFPVRVRAAWAWFFAVRGRRRGRRARAFFHVRGVLPKSQPCPGVLPYVHRFSH